MSEIINGKEIAKSLKEGLAAKVVELNEKYGCTPNLVVILVGDDPGSVSYVTGKAKAANEVGIRNTTLRFPDTITEEELLAKVEELNNDADVDGILVQLPLPKHIDESKVIAAISIEKDVDAFAPLSVARLWLKQPTVVPCTPNGIIKLLKSTGVEIEGKEAVVIDVGVNRDSRTGKLCGDVDYEHAKEVAAYITPVPGGVGPMTIACLMENTVENFIKKVEK